MKERLLSVVYMFLITLCFTSMVSAVQFFTQDRIDRNEKVKQQRVVLKVLHMLPGPAVRDREVVRIFETRVRSRQVDGITVYEGFKADGTTPQGYAFPVGGPGFWGPVFGMVAVKPDFSEIMGLAFYKHSETPGLGGRMTEPWFTDQFVGLSLHPPDGQEKIFHLRPEGSRKAPNDLDAITGATQTSRAIEAFLNKDLVHFTRDIRKSLVKKSTLLWKEQKKNAFVGLPCISSRFEGQEHATRRHPNGFLLKG